MIGISKHSFDRSVAMMPMDPMLGALAETLENPRGRHHSALHTLVNPVYTFSYSFSSFLFTGWLLISSSILPDCLPPVVPETDSNSRFGPNLLHKTTPANVSSTSYTLSSFSSLSSLMRVRQSKSAADLRPRRSLQNLVSSSLPTTPISARSHQNIKNLLCYCTLPSWSPSSVRTEVQ